MNRKDFLATTFSAGLGLALMPTFLSCKTTKPINRSVFEPLNLSTGNLAKVRGNVSRYTNKGGTVGIFETKEGFVIIDAQFPDTIKPVLDGISAKGKPIEFLCNTHHHGDHTSGNISFKDWKSEKKIVIIVLFVSICVARDLQTSNYPYNKH